tara:strand:+ start:95 stop:1072 length:978 start_codon:yes stop_codon:yes gene_type:complete
MAIYLGSLELATGGGATGTGLPVNTYESFSVSTTGNPTGYNATTGLYTHPNGDYWLKTGNTLAGVNSTYPDANVNYQILTQFETSSAFSTTFVTRGLARTSTNWYALEQTTGAVREYTVDATTGNLSGGGGIVFTAYANMQAMTSNGTTLLIPSSGTNLVERTTSGGSTGFSFSVAYQGSSILGLGYYDDGGDGVYIVYTSVASPHFQGGRVATYNAVTGVATGFGFQGGGTKEGCAFDGNNYYVMGEQAGAPTYQYDLQGVSTGYNVNLGSAGGASLQYYNGYFFCMTAGAYTMEVTRVAFGGIGDTTARTDTDTTKPLFIKIK